MFALNVPQQVHSSTNKQLVQTLAIPGVFCVADSFLDMHYSSNEMSKNDDSFNHVDRVLCLGTQSSVIGLLPMPLEQQVL
jgi:hypothetical protein